jgi:hypothetical protein
MTFLGQIIGILGFLVTAFAFLQSDEKKLKKILTTSTLVWLLHFILIKSYSAAAITFIIGLRQVSSVYFHNSNYNLKLKLSIFFIFLSFVVSFIFWKNIYSVFPLISSISATVAMLLLNGKKMRYGFLSAESSWLINNLHVESIGGILANITNIFLLSRNIYKENKK